MCTGWKIETRIITVLSSGPYEGGKPDATLSFKDEDFIKIALGKMNPQIAFLRYLNFVLSSLDVRFCLLALMLMYLA